MAEQLLKKISYQDGNNTRQIQVESAVRDGSGNVISTFYQPKNAKLTSFAALGSGTGFVKISNGTVSIDGNTYLTVCPSASTSVVGGGKLYSSTTQTVAPNSVTDTTGRTYAVQLNSSGQLVVNVPWTNVNPDGVTCGGTLEANKIVIGNNGTMDCVTSSCSIATSSTTWDGTSDVLVPTMKAINAKIPTVTWRPIAIAGNNILGAISNGTLNFVNTGNVTFSGGSSTGVQANVALPQIIDYL